MVARQYDVCINPDRASRSRFPYLIVLQSDLLQPLETVIAAPLVAERKSNPIAKLNPSIRIEGKDYRVTMQDMAGVPRSRLGSTVSNASEQHAEFIAAIDLLFTGI